MPDSQAPKRLLTVPQPIDAILDPEHDLENRILSQLGPDTLLMVGDNPALAKMPERPTILDFFRLRFRKLAVNHMLQSARNALKAGHNEKIVLACLLHDVALGGLIRADHGYWGAQMIAPYVDEEVFWAVRHHQALRYFADPAVNYEYPAAYIRFWGADYKIPDYLQRDYEARVSIAGMAAHARSRCLISIPLRKMSRSIHRSSKTSSASISSTPKKASASTIRRSPTCGARSSGPRIFCKLSHDEIIHHINHHGRA